MSASTDMISIEVDTDAAQRAVAAWEDAVDDGGKEAVSQLSVLAEGAMKRNAPEGAGLPNVHLRNTIQALPEGRTLSKTIMPHKRTKEGWLLVNAIVGNPTTPTYVENKPPVWIDRPGGDAQGPIAQWADAKLGDQNAAWAVANSIQNRGTQLSFPNPFVRDSFLQWRSQISRVATDAVADHLSGGST